MTTPENSQRREFSPHWHPPYDPPRTVVIDGVYDPALRESMLWHRSKLPRWLRRAAPSTVGAPRRGFRISARDLFKAVAIAVCAALLGLCLPGYGSVDYWYGMAAFVVALVVAASP